MDRRFSLRSRPGSVSHRGGGGGGPGSSGGGLAAPGGGGAEAPQTRALHTHTYDSSTDNDIFALGEAATGFDLDDLFKDFGMSLNQALQGQFPQMPVSSSAGPTKVRSALRAFPSGHKPGPSLTSSKLERLFELADVLWHLKISKAVFERIYRVCTRLCSLGSEVNIGFPSTLRCSSANRKSVSKFDKFE